MKPRRLPLLTVAIAGLICIANTASAQLSFKPTTEDASKDTKNYENQPSGSFPSNLNVVPADIAHFLSLVLGGVGMLHLLRRRSRARLV